MPKDKAKEAKEEIKTETIEAKNETDKEKSEVIEDVDKKDGAKKEKNKKEKPTPSIATPKKQSLRRKHVPKARIYIVCSYNNTVLTVTDPNGDVLGWSTSGSLGFKGPKKSTPFAATLVTQKVIEKTARFGIKEVQIFIRGVGGGREASVRAIGGAGLIINSIKDITPVPHNGCRQKKPRRM